MPLSGGWKRFKQDFQDSHPPTPCSVGGGVAAQSRTLTIKLCTIAHNSVEHPLNAFGGGISSDFFSVISLLNSTIANNSVTANIAAGGGSYGQAWIASTVFTNNVATALGWCVWRDSTLRCPASFGGAVFGLDVVTNIPLINNTATHHMHNKRGSAEQCGLSRSQRFRLHTKHRPLQLYTRLHSRSRWLS